MERYAAAIERVDCLDVPVRANPRTGVLYLPGVKSMTEVELVHHVHSLVDPLSVTQVRYPQSRSRCDHVTDGQWVEVKFVHLVGDNGRPNDFAPAKVLSPFVKDRSLLHDVHRLRSVPAPRAVIAVGFSYSIASCDHAMVLHPDHSDRVSAVRRAVVANGGVLSPLPLFEMVDSVLGVPGYVVPFSAWRHPCGGEGVVCGWRV